MIRHVKRWFAVRSYFWRLSQELVRHFGRRGCFTIEQVTQVAQRGEYNAAFLAYAHAMFCSRADFDNFYGPLHVACTYDGLRGVVERRYFPGIVGFDAMTIIRATKQMDDDGFDESGLAG